MQQPMMFFVFLDSLTDMDVHLGVLLILTGLTGFHSITVREVSVKEAGSISIPCLYLLQYKDDVKYLCKGYYFNSCDYKVRTDQKNSTKFSISDDKIKRIFTVTINDLTNDDTDYWCAVEIYGADVRNYFHLSVTGGQRSFFVDNQQKNAFQGGDITINCHYWRYLGEFRWCKMGRSCVTAPSGFIDETTVTINASVPNVFSVTMSRLRLESSGWYLCVSGKFQVPVHLSVTEQPTTTPHTVRHSSVSAGTTPPTVPEGPNGKAPFGLMESLILTSALIFTLMAALFFCFMLKRHKQNKAASPAMKEAEEEVTYSVVKPSKKLLSERSCVEQDVDVTYSTVVSMRQQRVQKVEANDNNVTYSTLAFH